MPSKPSRSVSRLPTWWPAWIGPISVKAAVAELMVMTLFVYIGTGTATAFGSTSGFNNEVQAGTSEGDVTANVEKVTENILTNASWGITTAFAFGLAITAMAFASGHISGGQMNPVVTISLFLAGSLGLAQAVANIVSQCAGAILASGLVYATIPNASSSMLGANGLANGVSSGNAVCGEIVMTFVLVMVVLQVAHSANSITKSQAPLAIGFAVFCGHAVLLPIDGCSINPARSLGPAVVANQWKNFWVFVVGPLLGGLLAVPSFYYFKWVQWDTAREGGDPLQLDGIGAVDGKEVAATDGTTQKVAGSVDQFGAATHTPI